MAEYEVTVHAAILVNAEDEDEAAEEALQSLDFGICEITSSGVEDIRLIGE